MDYRGVEIQPGIGKQELSVCALLIGTYVCTVATKDARLRHRGCYGKQRPPSYCPSAWMRTLKYASVLDILDHLWSVPQLQ